jgi:transcriptional accessory protein Tex/SPT6
MLSRELSLTTAQEIKTNPEAYFGDHKYDLLDMTRLIPDYYPLARKIAITCLDEYEQKDKDIDAVEVVLRDPKRLEQLDLKEFVKKSEDKSTSVNVAVNMIQEEFRNPFKDKRPPHRDLTASELFSPMVGDESFKVGHIVLGW